MLCSKEMMLIRNKVPDVNQKHFQDEGKVEQREGMGGDPP